MTVSAQSLQSYALLKDELGERQEQVLNSLRIAPASNRALSCRLKLSINQITPRVKELRDMGLVEPAYQIMDFETNRMVQVWRVSE